MATTQRATFGIGGLWRAAQFGRHPGYSCRLGFVGGHVDNPTPEQVASGSTGHVEVVEIEFDPAIVDYEWLLTRFWESHDVTAVPPTGRRGRPEHRSTIFFHDEEQEAAARAWLEDPYGTILHGNPGLAQLRLPMQAPKIVTEVRPVSTFWPVPAGYDGGGRPMWQAISFRRNPGPEVVGAFDDLIDLTPRPPVVHGAEGVLPPFIGQIDRERLTLLLDDADHVAAAEAAMRRSAAARGPRKQRQVAANSSILVASDVSEIRLRWAWDDADHTFAVNFQPGNYLSWPLLEEHAIVQFVAEPLPGSDHLVVSYSTGGHGRAHRSYLDAAAGLSDLPSQASGPWLEDDDIQDGGWTAFVPPVSCQLDVGSSAPHRVDWRRGRLIFGHHRGKLADELTLSALAEGSPCPCLLLPQIWSPDWIRQRWYDSSVAAILLSKLTSLPSSWSISQTTSNGLIWNPDDDLLDHPELDETPAAAAVRDDSWWPQPVTRMAAYRYAIRRIALLPEVLLRRWLVGALVDLEGRRDELNYFDRANLSTLALAPLRQAIWLHLWPDLRNDRHLRYTHLVCKLLRPGELPRAEAFVDDESATAHLLVSVPLSWLYTVWLRGLSVVDGLLVLSVEGPTDAEVLEAVVVGWRRDGGDEEPPRLVAASTKLRWDGELWHAADVVGDGQPFGRQTTEGS